jgi:hypothetical protein
MNDELEIFGRKRSWPNFKVIFWHSLEGNEENHEIPGDIRSAGRDFNPGAPE